MVGFVEFWGIVMIIAGAIYFVKPAIAKQMMQALIKKQKNCYLAGALAIVIGVLFLNAANRCIIPWIVVLFGLIAIAKGVAALVIGEKKIAALVNWVSNKPPKTLRMFAIAKIVLGIILIYAA